VQTLPDELRLRLSKPLPGLDAQLRMAPNPRRMPDPGATLLPAAALLLIYPHADQWHVPLTVRGSGLRHHTGQVSLPGGRLDDPGESVEDAALREAFEEIGIVPAEVEILGRMTPLPIAVSGHMLHPVIGVAAARPAFALAAEEVERLIELPIPRLLTPDVIAWEQRMRSSDTVNVPYFAIDGARVWGATAMVLAEFIALLEDIDFHVED